MRTEARRALSGDSTITREAERCATSFVKSCGVDANPQEITSAVKWELERVQSAAPLTMGATVAGIFIGGLANWAYDVAREMSGPTEPPPPRKPTLDEIKQYVGDTLAQLDQEMQSLLAAMRW